MTKRKKNEAYLMGRGSLRMKLRYLKTKTLMKKKDSNKKLRRHVQRYSAPVDAIVNI